MTQEEKQLLLTALCGYLPYRVKMSYNGEYDVEPEPFILCEINRVMVNAFYEIEGCKPYLRPMSSMTEEEEKEYHNLCYEEEREEFEFGEWATKTHYHDTIDSIDYLNSIHIDYRGLIPKGLAIEAPADMYNIKEE